MGGQKHPLFKAVRMLTPSACSSAAQSSTPARRVLGTRWYVLAAIFLLSFITIVDRVCISAAKTSMSRDLQISDLSFGFVFGAFALGYAVLMVPSGWFADRYGPRRFLAAIVALWSCFTLTTGLARALAPLIAIRFGFGIAEAGAYPTATRAIYNWFPIRERGLALGLLNTGSRLGAAFGLAAMSVSIATLGWRASYYLLAGVGFVWAAFWFFWFQDRPQSKRGLTPDELKLIRDSRGEPQPKPRTSRATWRIFLSSPNFYLILFQYFASNFTFFICFTWLLPYMEKRYRLSPAEAAFYASIPLYCGAFATWFGGYIVDAIYKRGHWKISRSLPAACGFGMSAVCLLLAGHVSTVHGFVLCFALATLGVDLSISPSWTISSDVGQEYTGTLSAAMNMMGSLGSVTSSLAFPYFLKLTGGIQTYFFVAAALNVLAIACWLYAKPQKPLVVNAVAAA
jgi:ACS family glucarate transporter-like MFS transporter